MRHIPVLSSINLSLSFSLDNCCVGVEDLFGDGEGKFRIHLYFKAVIFFLDVLIVKVFQHVKCFGCWWFFFVTFTDFFGWISTFLLNILLNKHYAQYNSVSADWYILAFSLNRNNSFIIVTFLLIHLALFFNWWI